MVEDDRLRHRLPSEAGEGDTARVGGRNPRLWAREAKSDAQMSLVCRHLLAVVGYRSRSSPNPAIGLEFGRPEGRRRTTASSAPRFAADRSDPIGISDPLIAVEDQKENFEIAPLELRVPVFEIRQDVGQELIGDLDLVPSEGLLFHMRPGRPGSPGCPRRRLRRLGRRRPRAFARIDRGEEAGSSCPTGAAGKRDARRVPRDPLIIVRKIDDACVSAPEARFISCPIAFSNARPDEAVDDIFNVR